MKVELIQAVGEPALSLEAAARRALFRSMVGAIVRVMLVSALAGWFGWTAADNVDVPPVAGALLLAFVGGASMTIRVAARHAAVMGAVAAHPLEMILGHVASAGEDIAGELRSLQRTPANVADLAADVAMLSARFTDAQTRSREILIELEAERTKATLQNAAKSQFLANMSHELRTPLNAVLGYAMLLQEDAKAAGNMSAVTDLDRIAVAGRHLLALINDILDLSRLDSGKTTVERAVIDIHALVEAVAADSDRSADVAGCKLNVRIAEGVGIMTGDVAKVRQCLLNLITYARKSEEGAAIDLEVTLKDSPAAVAVFTIDNVSAESDVVERMFDPLVESASLGTSRFDGSELSLAVTRRLARLMGGDVEVIGMPGRKSALVLTLPHNRVSRTGRVTEGKIEEIAQIVPIAAGTSKAERSALVIDDNAAALDLMQRWLAKLDYEVVGATTGDEGLTLAKTRRFDLIILDVFMPDRSGYDVLRELREDAVASDIPVILVTVDDDRAKALDAGATEYIRKPVSEAQLRAMLEIYRQPAAGDILVIEDDDDAAQLVVRCAEQVGFAARRAVDGFEGIAMATSRRPSAIVLDLAMPRCDGFNVIEALLANEALAAVPVIVLSAGEISVEDHKRIAEAGYRFLSKGVLSPREIAAQLRELVA